MAGWLVWAALGGRPPVAGPKATIRGCGLRTPRGSCKPLADLFSISSGLLYSGCNQSGLLYCNIPDTSKQVSKESKKRVERKSLWLGCCKKEATKPPSDPSKVRQELGVPSQLAACVRVCGFRPRLGCRDALQADAEPRTGLSVCAMGVDAHEIGDWVTLGFQVGSITKIDHRGLHAVQITGRQFWRKPEELRPLFGSSGVPKQEPEVGDFVRFIPPTNPDGRRPGAGPQPTASSAILPNRSTPNGFSFGQVSRIKAAEGRLCVQLGDGTSIWRARTEVQLPDDNAPCVPLQAAAVQPKSATARPSKVDSAPPVQPPSAASAAPASSAPKVVVPELPPIAPTVTPKLKLERIGSSRSNRGTRELVKDVSSSSTSASSRMVAENDLGRGRGQKASEFLAVVQEAGTGARGELSLPPTLEAPCSLLARWLTRLLTHSLTHALAYSRTRLLTHSRSRTRLLTHSLSLASSLLASSLARCSLARCSLARSLTHSLTHSLTRSRTHSLT